MTQPEAPSRWQRWTEVDGYFDARLIPADPTLDAAIAAITAAGMPAHSVSPSQGKLLHLLARAMGARSVLEIGTLGGYSTIWLARALPDGGRVVTLEADALHAEVAQANLERAGVADRVEIRVGLAVDSLAALAAEDAGPFDLVFIDADKESNTAYLRWSLQLTRPGSLLVADNVVRGGAIVDPEAHDASIAGVREFADALAAERSVNATAIQTVGGKGYDGFVLALVTTPA